MEAGGAERGSPQDLVRVMPFAEAVGVTLEVARPDEVRGSVAWSAERCTAGGVLHGGALMTLADSLGGICAFMNLPPGAQTSTIASNTSFLRAVREGEVVGVARPVHVGRRVITVRTELTDDRGRPVAEVVQSQAVLPAAD